MASSARRLLIETTVIGQAFAAVLFLRFFLPAGGWEDVTGHPIGRDFLNVWGAPRVVAEHGAAALADLARYPLLLEQQFGQTLKMFFNWSYPPHALIVLAPFSWAPYGVALGLWTLGGLGAFAFVVRAGLPAERRRVAIAAAVLSPAAFWCVATGQNGLLLGALVLGAVLCLDRRPVVAGVLIGLLTIKPQLGLLIPVALIAAGAWRTIFAAAATALALALCALALYGLEPWRLWLTTTAGYQFALLTDIVAFHRYMMVSIAASGGIAGLPPVLIWPLQGLGAALAAVAVWTTFRRTDDPATRALVLSIGAALATPYAFNYDLTAMTGATIWLLSRRGELGPWERRVFGLMLLSPVAIVPLHMIGAPIAPLILLAGLWIVTPRRAVPAAEPLSAAQP
ncbi:glycosyltransferase family 87 protein [Methylopila musalis]|uniref:Glycosyltransferase family 87 protein n=1 Tax=Methylopila musalis TaxID=1134781 RepID=A0ABW3Z4J4_9HYPH